MPRSPRLTIDAALPEEKTERIPLSSHQKTTSLSLALIIAGYAAFADFMECVYTMQPLRSEYEIEQQVSEKTWLVVAIATAGIYSLSTLLSEGKGVYDSVSDYFQNSNHSAVPPREEERSELIEPQPTPPTLAERAPQTCSKKLGSSLAWLLPRLLSIISSAADSSETTMGLVNEGAPLPKVIAISALSFLGSVSFYGPITAEALEQILYGIKPLPALENNRSRLLAKIVGYPVALFSALQDTLECGASLFQNFGITSIGGQWAIVGASSLAGMSGLCLDGKKGVEILDHFFDHLEKHYAWLPQGIIHRHPPTRAQLYQFATETSSTALAAYAASFIAFANKELTIELSKTILATLGAEIPLLPFILGWCVLLRDFVIQTNTLRMLEQLIFNVGYRGWESLSRNCSRTQRQAAPLLRQQNPEEVELVDFEEEDEEAALLPANHRSLSPKTEDRFSFVRFFKAKPPQRDYLEQEQGQKLSCSIL